MRVTMKVLNSYKICLSKKTGILCGFYKFLNVLFEIAQQVNLGRVHAKLKEVKKEIDRREHLHKPTEDLTELYKELCVIFFEYYNAFSEEVE